MTFSYSGNPGSSTKDLVRFLITDTDSSDPLFQDDEINYLVSLWGSDGYGAAIAAVRTLIGRSANLSSQSKKVGDLSLTTVRGMEVTKYMELIKQLEKERFNVYPAAPVVNPNAILPTHIGIVEGEGTDYVVGQMDNLT
jgi:hypothetical protein